MSPGRHRPTPEGALSLADDVQILDTFVRSVVIGVIAAAPIGPVNLVCIQRTLAFGRLSGLIAGLGAAIADGLFATVAAFGLTTVSDFLIDHDSALRLVGGLFLLVLGARTVMTLPRTQADLPTRGTLGQTIGTTFLMTITNPVTILGFAALFSGAGLVQDARDSAGALQIVAGVAAGSALWWLCLSTGVGFLHGKLELRHMRWMNRISGSLIFAFGLVALASLVPGLRLF